jgi:hypothetical protein
VNQTPKLRQPPGQVYVLAVKEQPLVEAADVLERVPAHR